MRAKQPERTRCGEFDAQRRLPGRRPGDLRACGKERRALSAQESEHAWQVTRAAGRFGPARRGIARRRTACRGTTHGQGDRPQRHARARTLTGVAESRDVHRMDGGKCGKRDQEP
jgi:hypothetical protein